VLHGVSSLGTTDCVLKMIRDESKVVMKETFLVYVRMPVWTVVGTAGRDGRFLVQDCNQPTHGMLRFSWVPCSVTGLLDLRPVQTALN
jgi:hypothetical protein